jgi:ubiquinone/menaquinone biosynthesis C-methylase UbiE
MLELARQEAAARGLTNMSFAYADAEALPYADCSFDLVTCRIAPHHFGDVPLFVAEAARVLQKGGYLAVVDNIVPDHAGGDYVNAFEKLRDPSHNRCLSGNAWLAIYSAAGLSVTHSETVDKEVNFEFWAKRHDAPTQKVLRAMLSSAPQIAAEFLRPVSTKEGTFFHLQEGIFLGQKTS